MALLYKLADRNSFNSNQIFRELLNRDPETDRKTTVVNHKNDHSSIITLSEVWSTHIKPRNQNKIRGCRMDTINKCSHVSLHDPFHL